MTPCYSPCLLGYKARDFIRCTLLGVENRESLICCAGIVWLGWTTLIITSTWYLPTILWKVSVYYIEFWLRSLWWPPKLSPIEFLWRITWSSTSRFHLHLEYVWFPSWRKLIQICYRIRKGEENSAPEVQVKYCHQPWISAAHFHQREKFDNEWRQGDRFRQACLLHEAKLDSPRTPSWCGL